MVDYKKYSLFFFVILILIFASLVNTTNTDSINTTEKSIIVSVCTGNMRALETGVSVYAGYNEVPLILSDKTLPDQLSSWLPGYIKENNIDKIIVVGPVDFKQLLNFYMMGVNVEQINGNSISEILTKIADNTLDKNNDTLIFSASDHMAGLLGAYTKIPVFMTASNSTYESSKNLDSNYKEYIKTHNIKHVIIVGNLPETLKDDLKEFNLTIEELGGSSSTEVSKNVNNKLKSLGYINNSSVTYYGFYGELPTVIPMAVKNNAMMIEDSSNQGDVLDYLKENNVTSVYFTRNKESDYIQMEEEDYISSDIIKEFENNNISVNYLTKNRTLDEATGLYDMKIISAENMMNKNILNETADSYNIVKSKPPLLEILNYPNWEDSNNISVSTHENNYNNYTVNWSTIHPYQYIKNNETSYYITSNTGYEYIWTYSNLSWDVEYIYKNNSYYHVKWIENENNSWTEIHPDTYYTWQFNQDIWYCYDKSSKLIYTIKKV